MAVKPIAMSPSMNRIEFPEENMDLQGAIERASKWAHENKGKIEIDSSEFGFVYDQKHFEETGNNRFARAVIIRYKDK